MPEKQTGSALSAEQTAAPAQGTALDGCACEILAHGTPVWVNSQHRFGTDAMLLSHFCRVHRAERTADLGSGCGIIPLRWHDGGHRGPALAVELQPAAAALLQKALTQCPDAAAHITGICDDLCTAALPADFIGCTDAVSCNPPYFTGGIVSPDPARAAARHQLHCTLADVCRTAAALLRDGGRLCICQRPAALGVAIAAFVNAGLQPKRLRFVRQRPGAAPWLFLLDGRKAGGEGLTMEPDLIMERPDGSGFSEEVLTIYGKK